MSPPLSKAKVYQDLNDLPHRGNMSVEKRYNTHFYSVDAHIFHHVYPKCISVYCTYEAKSYVNYYFYQHLASNGAIFLNGYVGTR